MCIWQRARKDWQTCVQLPHNAVITYSWRWPHVRVSCFLWLIAIFLTIMSTLQRSASQCAPESAVSKFEHNSRLYTFKLMKNEHKTVRKLLPYFLEKSKSEANYIPFRNRRSSAGNKESLKRRSDCYDVRMYRENVAKPRSLIEPVVEITDSSETSRNIRLCGTLLGDHPITATSNSFAPGKSDGGRAAEFVGPSLCDLSCELRPPQKCAIKRNTSAPPGTLPSNRGKCSLPKLGTNVLPALQTDLIQFEAPKEFCDEPKDVVDATRIIRLNKVTQSGGHIKKHGDSAHPRCGIASKEFEAPCPIPMAHFVRLDSLEENGSTNNLQHNENILPGLCGSFVDVSITMSRDSLDVNAASAVVVLPKSSTLKHSQKTIDGSSKQLREGVHSNAAADITLVSDVQVSLSAPSDTMLSEVSSANSCKLVGQYSMTKRAVVGDDAFRSNNACPHDATNLISVNSSRDFNKPSNEKNVKVVEHVSSVTVNNNFVDVESNPHRPGAVHMIGPDPNCERISAVGGLSVELSSANQLNEVGQNTIYGAPEGEIRTDSFDVNKLKGKHSLHVPVKLSSEACTPLNITSDVISFIDSDHMDNGSLCDFNIGDKVITCNSDNIFPKMFTASGLVKSVLTKDEKRLNKIVAVTSLPNRNGCNIMNYTDKQENGFESVKDGSKKIPRTSNECVEDLEISSVYISPTSFMSDSYLSSLFYTSALKVAERLVSTIFNFSSELCWAVTNCSHTNSPPSISTCSLLTKTASIPFIDGSYERLSLDCTKVSAVPVGVVGSSIKVLSDDDSALSEDAGVVSSVDKVLSAEYLPISEDTAVARTVTEEILASCSSGSEDTRVCVASLQSCATNASELVATYPLFDAQTGHSSAPVSATLSSNCLFIAERHSSEFECSSHGQEVCFIQPGNIENFDSMDEDMQRLEEKLRQFEQDLEEDLEISLGNYTSPSKMPNFSLLNKEKLAFAALPETYPAVCMNKSKHLSLMSKGEILEYCESDSDSDSCSTLSEGSSGELFPRRKIKWKPGDRKCRSLEYVKRKKLECNLCTSKVSASKTCREPDSVPDARVTSDEYAEDFIMSGYYWKSSSDLAYLDSAELADFYSNSAPNGIFFIFEDDSFDDELQDPFAYDVNDNCKDYTLPHSIEGDEISYYPENVISTILKDKPQHVYNASLEKENANDPAELELSRSFNAPSNLEIQDLTPAKENQQNAPKPPRRRGSLKAVVAGLPNPADLMRGPSAVEVPPLVPPPPVVPPRTNKINFYPIDTRLRESETRFQPTKDIL